MSKDETNSIPNYITKKPDFYCPVSPYIMWHHNLEYKECPLKKDQRDMGSCANCKLRGDSKVKIKAKPHRDAINKSQKKKKEVIPNIGKTYTSK